MSNPTPSTADRGAFGRFDVHPPRRLRRRAATAGLVGLGYAAAVAISSWALPGDRNQPIHIQAGEGNYDPASGVSVLTGAVQVDQGTLRLRAATVTLSNGDDGELERIVADGTSEQPATFRQRLNADEPPVNARAQRIDYAVTEQRIELKGSAFLSQSDREFSGEVIFWDIEQGRVDARSDAPGGVRLKWQPPPQQNAD